MSRVRAAAVVSAIVALASCVAGCLGSDGVAPYKLSASANESPGGDIDVRGKSNMPDGGIVTVYAWSDTEQRHREWMGSATVRGAVFTSLVPVATWRARTVHFSIGINGDPGQSAAVLAVIGPDGERLSGATVQTAEDGSRFIEARFDVELDVPSPS